MGLNESKGNMYDFVTHTYNTVKGECPHACGYCYMKLWGKQNPPYFDNSELKTNLGENNFIFVGSSIDLFADGIPEEWISWTLDYCDQFNNRYLFQSKNPARIIKYINHPVFKKSVVCTTIETNRLYPDVVCNCPIPKVRAEAMSYLSNFVKIYVTIEPVMKFDLVPLVRMLRSCKPEQVNIGADSGNNKLPEPTAWDIANLIGELQRFTIINKKKNLNRLLV